MISPAGSCACKEGFYISKDGDHCPTRDCYACSPCYPSCKTCSDSQSTCKLLIIIWIVY